MTNRRDKRLLRRSLIASRGRTGRKLPSISKLADRGVIWPLLGAAMYASPRLRGSGVAGVGGVVLTSGLTAILQIVVRRDRPSRLTALFARGSRRRPSSGSFPSTHAANAAAFAAAATTVRPVLGPVLLPAAAAIGAARVAMAHHYPSDVIAGATIGAGVGTVTGIVVRRRRRRPRADDRT